MATPAGRLPSHVGLIGGIRPHEVLVIVFEDHFDLERWREVAAIPFTHLVRTDEVGNLRPQPGVVQVGVANGTATDPGAPIGLAPAARTALATSAV